MTERKYLDWAATALRALDMTHEQLWGAIRDCHAAGIAALQLEREGFRVSKTQGYYADEASVYRAEIERRRKTPR